MSLTSTNRLLVVAAFLLFVLGLGLWLQADHVIGTLVLLLAIGLGMYVAGLERARRQHEHEDPTTPITTTGDVKKNSNLSRTEMSGVALENAALHERLGYRSDLLQLITGAEPRAIILADKWERILFANAEAVRRAGRHGDEVIGSTLSTILGEAGARRAKERILTAFRNQSPVMATDYDKAGMLQKIVQSGYIPVADTKHIKDAILITETDVTDIVTERERRERMARQILDVCVAVVDRRDPYASGHSELVGELAKALATQMGEESRLIETAEIAGLLMNFGKVMVPQEILTKTEALTPEELKLVRESMLSSADVLSLISFDLPVVATLRQVFERFDGTGMPLGRRGADIISTARICAVANAFVALVSPRAHRPSQSPLQALGILQQQAGTAYDPAVLQALSQILGSGADLSGRLSKLLHVA